MRQIVLDTETTGLHTHEGHRIIEVGCIELMNRKFTGKKFHQFINPQRKIDDGALSIHGITNQFLEDKPLFSEIAEDLLAFIRDAELIIHNAAFDVGFIDYEFALTKKSYQPIASHCRIIDTLILARQLHTGQRNNLDALCKRYGIDNSDRSLHGALLDANLLAQVYLAMTGGQGSLFDGLQPTVTVTVENVSKIVPNSELQKNLLVQKADAEELKLHEALLEVIGNKGKCLWQE